MNLLFSFKYRVTSFKCKFTTILIQNNDSQLINNNKHSYLDQSDISIEETFGPIFGDVDPINPPTGIPITLRSVSFL